MVANVETIFKDLQQLIVELEKLLQASKGEATTHAEEAVTNWRNALQGAQQRLEKMQESTRQRVADAVRTASHALRDNPGKSVAIIAAAGILLGLALGGHDRSQR
jgi:ElaB/YqjD/DUF883 family membrane-anchored ribosome-binding protein